MTRRTIMNSIVALPIAAAMPVAAPTMPPAGDDRALLEMAGKFFKLMEVIDEPDPEIRRLQEIWVEEMIRLDEAS
jgi:hypothetical protein